MAKLTDTQSILLSHASQRDTLSFYPLPERLTGGGPRVSKAIATLIKAGLAEERETTEIGTVGRQDGDITLGLFATIAGMTAIGLVPGGSEPSVSEPAPEPRPTQPRQTKAALVLAMLQGEGGATIAELIAATGWLPHTTRAALTGLRKKGHDIIKGQRDGSTCYSINKAAA